MISRKEDICFTMVSDYRENRAEEIYILKRRMKAFAGSLLFVMFRICPIKNNKIAVCTFEGKGGFGCNPKYIVEELHKRNFEYKFIWFVNDATKEFPDYITKVKNTLWNRAKHLSTSKIWIDNYRKPYGTIKRKGQYYFNTWHGTIGFKVTGLFRGKAFSKMAYLVSKNDSDMVDYFVIDSEWCNEFFPDGLVYYGDFLKYGAPRCDVLYGDRSERKASFKTRFKILDENARFIMFAPTFREQKNNGVRSVFSKISSLDFKRLLDNLEKKWDGRWYLCIRVHPQLANVVDDFSLAGLNDRIINLSKEDDMYELLAAMDVLITDYSSVAMDAGFAEIPVFIYADDLQEYIKDRGGLLWEMSADSKDDVKNNKKMTPNIDTKLPYMIAQDNDEIEENIMQFDYEHYKHNIERFKQDVQLVFDGKASIRVADMIEQLMGEKK